MRYYKISKDFTFSNGKNGVKTYYGDLISNNGVKALFCVDGEEIFFKINAAKFYKPKKGIWGWDEIILPYLRT